MAKSTLMYLGSDETYLHVCDICSEDDRNVEAVSLCSICDQYFCATCKTMHGRSNATRTRSCYSG